MTSSIYDQHDKAFPQVSAYVVTAGASFVQPGRRVGTVAFKHPRDGAGRLWCYLHLLGSPMVRGYAGGYGYCKTDAAISSAASHAETPSEDAAGAAFIKALLPDDGNNWDWHLREAGFDVIQAV